MMYFYRLPFDALLSLPQLVVVVLLCTSSAAAVLMYMFMLLLPSFDEY